MYGLRSLIHLVNSTSFIRCCGKSFTSKIIGFNTNVWFFRYIQNERYQGDPRTLRIWERLADNSMGHGYEIYQHAHQHGCLLEFVILFVVSHFTADLLISIFVGQENLRIAVRFLPPEMFFTKADYKELYPWTWVLSCKIFAIKDLPNLFILYSDFGRRRRPTRNARNEKTIR